MLVKTLCYHNPSLSAASLSIVKKSGPGNKHDWVPQPRLPAFDELDPLEREVDALLIERGVIGARAGAKLFRQVSEEAAAPQVVGWRFIHHRAPGH
jgi:hypothetical protein